MDSAIAPDRHSASAFSGTSRFVICFGEAAASRYQALFVDLLACAEVQSITADAAPPASWLPPPLVPNGTPSPPVGAAARAVAVRAAGSGTSAPNSSSDEEDAAAAPPAPGNW